MIQQGILEVINFVDIKINNLDEKELRNMKERENKEESIDIDKIFPS